MTLTTKRARELADELGNLASDEGESLGWYRAQQRIVARYRLTTIQLQQVVDEYERD